MPVPQETHRTFTNISGGFQKIPESSETRNYDGNRGKPMAVNDYQKRTKVYISGPMTNGGKASEEEVKINIEVGLDIAMILHTYGITPIIPHLSYSWHEHMVERGAELDPDDYLLLDLSIITFCDILLRLPGRSRGADVEVLYAEDQKMPVVTSIDEVIHFDRKHRTKEDRKRERTNLRYLLSRQGYTSDFLGGPLGPIKDLGPSSLRH
jgi:hypothetical protein